MKAYEQFLRDAGTPIGVIGSIILTGWAVVWIFTMMFSTPPNEKAWQAECSQLAVGNTVLVERDRMGGQHFCMTLVPLEEYPILESSTTVWKAGCVTLGGVYRSWNSTLTCYRKVVVEELGSRETYEGTP